MDGGGSEVPDHKPVRGAPARKSTVMASAEGKSDAKAKLLFKRPEARSFNCLAVVEWCGGKAGGMTYNLDEVKAKIKKGMFVKRRRPSIFVGSGDGRIFCVHPFSKGSHYNWQCSTGYCQKILPIRRPKRIYYESFLKGLPPAPILVVLSMDGTLIAWDAESKRPSPLAQDTTHEDAINCGMILENSKTRAKPMLLTGSYDKTVREWHVYSDVIGERKHRSEDRSFSRCVHTSNVAVLSLTVWRGLLILGLKTGVIRVVSSRCWQQQRRTIDDGDSWKYCDLEWHSDYVTCLKVTREGWLFSASNDSLACAAPIQPFLRLKKEGSAGSKPTPMVFYGHEKGIFSMCVEGSIMLTGSADGTVKAWENPLTTDTNGGMGGRGRCLCTYRYHTDTVHNILLWRGKMYTCSGAAELAVWEPGRQCEFCPEIHEEGRCVVDEIECEHCEGWYHPTMEKSHKRLCENWPHFCPNGVFGCFEKLPLELMGMHLKTCRYRPRVCPHDGCGAKIPHCEYYLHTQERCEHRQVTCEIPDCGKVLTFKNLKAHLSEGGDCPEAPTRCPCCKAKIPHQRDLGLHKAQECPERLLTCQNCEEKCKARSITSHMKDTCRKRKLPCKGCGSLFEADTLDPQNPQKMKKKKKKETKPKAGYKRPAAKKSSNPRGGESKQKTNENGTSSSPSSIDDDNVGSSSGSTSSSNIKRGPSKLLSCRSVFNGGWCCDCVARAFRAANTVDLGPWKPARRTGGGYVAPLEKKKKVVKLNKKMGRVATRKVVNVGLHSKREKSNRKPRGVVKNGKGSSKSSMLKKATSSSLNSAKSSNRNPKHATGSAASALKTTSTTTPSSRPPSSVLQRAGLARMKNVR